MSSLPIVIVVRDRLSYLLGLLDALQAEPVDRICIVDMASTWPPLIEQYRRWSEHPKIRVYTTGQNLGARGLFKHPLLKRLVGSKPFILTDEDVIPERPCVRMLQAISNAHPLYAKVGVSLRIDDLPDHYPQKAKVVAWEKKFWTRQLGSFENSVLYDSEVATTFCFFKGLDWVNDRGDGSSCRVGDPYVARHIPWYENPAKLPQDVVHYYRNAPLRRWGVAEPGVTWTPLS